jgi:adenosine deaminase
MQADGGIKSFIQALPKTETHLHIEGALPYDLLREWRPEQFPENPAFRRPDFRYATFPEFERILLEHALPWFTSADRYYEAAKTIFSRHVAAHVLYVETSFHLPVTGFINVPGREIVAAIRSAAPRGLEVRVFAGMPRNAYQGPLRAVIDDLENWRDLSGVDLHGFEEMPTEAWSAPVWKRLRAAGKVTKCHAGEFGGPERVREAIMHLGVTRVQHGVRSVEDPDTVSLARDRGITFDVCPISNVRLKVAPSIREHPIRRLREAGVRCTVSTDDPLCFANSIPDEYAALAEEGGFSRTELASIASAGWEVADLSRAARALALSEIERLVLELRPVCP